MSYAVYASPLPVPVTRRDAMIGLRFATEAQALDRASTLRHAGWHVYRVTGPDGFEMTEDAIDQYCNAKPRTRASSQGTSG